MPSSLPRLLVPRRGGKAASCQPALLLQFCRWSDCDECRPCVLLLLLRLSSRCFALDFLTGAAGSSSGSLCTSQRDGDLKRRRGLVGEVTGEVNLCTRAPNMVIIGRASSRSSYEGFCADLQSSRILAGITDTRRTTHRNGVSPPTRRDGPRATGGSAT